MAWVRYEARNGLRDYVVALTALAAAALITSDTADARHHRLVRAHYAHQSGSGRHRAHAEGYSPPTSSIVVDGNTGQVLEASNPDASRHPASLTKIMTLYLLFERLDAGKIKLDTQLKVSQHAADQDPTKLNLQPGQTIAVEDAIKGVVTRSANDAAVVIAESLGGSEEDFAKLMTQQAHALGMSHTTYVNASGLPHDDQITTARDQALLGRAIQDRFPRYYRYFSTPAFVYHGVAIRNHDHLLSMDGVDGIKTGFTRASGFNLVTSIHRDGRYVVAAVLGGRSASERDAHMRELINDHIKEAALHRTAPAIAEQAPQHEEPQRVAVAKPAVPARADPLPTATTAASAAPGPDDPIKPLLVKTVSYRIAPAQPAPLTPMPPLVAVPAPLPQPAAALPQPAASLPQPALPQTPPPAAPVTVVASAEPVTAPIRPQPEPAKPEIVRSDAAKPAAASPEPVIPDQAPIHMRGGWMVQIGAFDGEDEAKHHLSAAQIKLHDMLAAADPFTERVQKGEKALYRARFAGFDKATAEAVCKQLKHNDFECMTLKN